jgi:GT2 family glycosyltransferase
MMSDLRKKVAVIFLNYNSEEDLFVSVEQVQQQKNMDLVTIIVDNASNSNTLKKIQNWSKKFTPSTFSGSVSEVYGLMSKCKINQHDFSTFFIYNQENSGYSSGNNVGIKIANYLNVDAVLIANPDMRFDDVNYISRLADVLFSNEKYYLAASKIVGLDGKDQNPLREPEFMEELLWPRQLFPSLFKIKPYVLPYETNKVITVPKVVGCCLLLRMDFLREINYFDETTFLYSEESILSSQVKDKQGQIAFLPYIEAIHAHNENTKGNSSKRMLLFIESRKYYLKNYSGYTSAQLLLLSISYAALKIAYKLKYRVRKWK